MFIFSYIYEKEFPFTVVCAVWMFTYFISCDWWILTDCGSGRWIWLVESKFCKYLWIRNISCKKSWIIWLRSIPRSEKVLCVMHDDLSKNFSIICNHRVLPPWSFSCHKLVKDSYWRYFLRRQNTGHPLWPWPMCDRRGPNTAIMCTVPGAYRSLSAGGGDEYEKLTSKY
jgi:hypothetical protein